MNNNSSIIEIMDTTLRDGEQTSGVSFSSTEKLSIAHLLLVDLGVNRIEIASARVSDGEFETVHRWNRFLNDNGIVRHLYYFVCVRSCKPILHRLRKS